MNTLCHLCLGLEDPEFLLGHFLGDYAKGSLETLPYPERVKTGIRAHRRVDAAGESHPFLKTAKSLLPLHHRRYGGIVLDLYGDYLLHKCWPQVMQSPWEGVSDRLGSFLRRPPRPFPAAAGRYAAFILNTGLLSAYGDSRQLPELFDRVGSRLRRPVSFSALLESLRREEAAFLERFPGYFSDMKKESDRILHNAS